MDKKAWDEFFQAKEMSRFMLENKFRNLEAMMKEELETRETYEGLRQSSFQFEFKLKPLAKMGSLITDVKSIYYCIIGKFNHDKSFEHCKAMIAEFEKKLKELIYFEECCKMKKFLRADAQYEEMEALGLFELGDKELDKISLLRGLVMRCACCFNFMESSSLIEEYEGLMVKIRLYEPVPA